VNIELIESVLSVGLNLGNQRETEFRKRVKLYSLKKKDIAMAAMRLQQALKSLCSKNGWCYAVFWKLKRHSQM
jgi:hypothetical protein